VLGSPYGEGNRVRLRSITHIDRLSTTLTFAAVLLLLNGCGGASSRIVPHSNERSAASAVTVAGDSPEEFQGNLDAARAAGKTVRVVSVARASGADLYSAYAQILRSRASLLVRVYGRIHVYQLDAVKVTYPPGTPVNITTLPLVETPTIDAALASGAALGASAAVRTTLCRFCDRVLLRSAGTAASSTLWADAKDPWQIAVDYVYWSRPSTPVASSQRAKSFLTNCGSNVYCCPSYEPPYVVCGQYYPPSDGGGGGGGCSFYEYGCGPPPVYIGRPRNFDSVQESACTTQHGRFISTDNRFFICRHQNQSSGPVVNPGDCPYLVNLPNNIHDPIQVIVFPFDADPLGSGGSTARQGIRVYTAECFWTGAGPNPAS
jgi:hypothetical protein